MKQYVSRKPNSNPLVRANPNCKSGLTPTTPHSPPHRKPWPGFRANDARQQPSPKDCCQLWEKLKSVSIDSRPELRNLSTWFRLSNKKRPLKPKPRRRGAKLERPLRHKLHYFRADVAILKCARLDSLNVSSSSKSDLPRPNAD